MNEKERIESARTFVRALWYFLGGVIITVVVMAEKIPVECTEWWQNCTELPLEISIYILLLGLTWLICLGVDHALSEKKNPEKKKCILCKQEKMK